MRCEEWIEKLNELAPESYACSWDNPGLLTGRSDKEIGKVLVALDATDEVVELAVREKADLLLTHHPLIFSPLKHVNDRDFIGRRLLRLIQNDICCYAMHTNFDAAPGCMADLAAARLHLVEGRPLELMGETGGVPYGIGKAGILLEAVTLQELAEQVKREFQIPFVSVYGAEQVKGLVRRAAVCPGSGKGMAEAARQAGAQVLITGDIGHHEELAAQVKEAFGLPYVTVYGAEHASERIRRAAVCPGSGKGMAREARNAGAQVLITGDIGHHDGIDAVADGVAVIDAGHYGLEHIFIDFMADYCREKIDGRADVITAPVSFPAEVW